MNILIVDDEKNVLNTTAVTVDTAGHKAFTAFNTRQADRILEEEDIHAILLDRMLHNESGLDYLERLGKEGNRRPVVIFTAHSSIESAVESMRKGAYTYIEKPFVPEQIRHTLKQLQERMKLDRRIEDLETQVASDYPLLLFDTAEPAIRDAYTIAFKAARSDASILLLGPSGTGKSVMAKRIHEASARSENPFVSISCPSLSKELLESELFGHVKGAFTGAVKEAWGKVKAAEGGTLFLDEIGDLPASIQPKLLRLLQEREFERIGEARTRSADVRIIAATNHDLEKAVQEGRFREDLLYRLNVISIHMPALAERQADIAALAENFLHFFARQQNRNGLHFSRDAMDSLSRYPWPGNLREMRNVIERAVILSDSQEITAELLGLPGWKAFDPPFIRPGQPVTLKTIEEEHIRRVIERSKNLETAADTLGIDTATLYRKRKRMGLIGNE